MTEEQKARKREMNKASYLRRRAEGRRPVLTEAQKARKRERDAVSHAKRLASLSDEQVAERKKRKHVNDKKYREKNADAIREKRRLQRGTEAGKTKMRARCCRYRQRHPERDKARKTAYAASTGYFRIRYLQLKADAMAAYGGKCECCGISELAFLTIDHANGDGAEHRRSLAPSRQRGAVNIYGWLKKNRYPTGFRVLCSNCNLSTHVGNGVCAHHRPEPPINNPFQKYRVSVKAEAILAYGGKCACCGESNPAFMTLDHVNGDGADHRRTNSMRGGTQTYAWARRHGFPNTLRLLCSNCNIATRNGRMCPHQTAGL